MHKFERESGIDEGSVKLFSISIVNLKKNKILFFKFDYILLIDRIINNQCILFFKFIVKDVVERFVRIFKI